MRINNLGVSVGRVGGVLMRKNRHNVGLGAIAVKVLRKCASAFVVQFMTEQQDSAPPKADLEQSGHNGLNAHNFIAYTLKHLASGFRQSCVR